MRILHTSDWHLGRSFGDHRLIDDQAQFLDWLVQVAKAEAVDLLVIAGDLYDRSVPPADAVELFHATLRRCSEAGIEVAAIAGNHDSAERVGSLDGLMLPGLLMRGGYRHASDVTVRHFSDGPLAIVALPFLDPAFAPTDLSPTGRATHETVLREAIGQAQNTVAAGVRTLAIAHAFVTGAEPSDSERTLAVGDAAMVSSSVFDGFDYVALGHLHRAQIVGGDERVRYCGAPLAYSFGETAQKEVVLIELDDDGDARSKPIPIDVGRRVATVRGTLEQLLGDRANLNDWVRVELTNEHPVADAHRRLRDHFPHLVEIVRCARPTAPANRLTASAVRERSTDELVRDFMQTVDSDVDPEDIELAVATLRRVERDAL